MKNQLIVLLFSLFFFNMYSQQVFYTVSNVLITPSTPLANDSVKITIKGFMSSRQIKQDSVSINVHDNTVSITIHFNVVAGPTVPMPINIEEKMILSPLQNGNYTLVINEKNNAYLKQLFTSEFQIAKNATAVNTIDNNAALYIYPNPVEKTIHIKTTNTSPSAIYIYDIKGNLVTISDLTGTINQIDCDLYNSGEYLVCLKNKITGELLQVQKMLKLK